MECAVGDRELRQLGAQPAHDSDRLERASIVERGLAGDSADPLGGAFVEPQHRRRSVGEPHEAVHDDVGLAPEHGCEPLFER